MTTDITNKLILVLTIASTLISCSPTDSASNNTDKIRTDSLTKAVKTIEYLTVDTTRETQGDLFYQFIQATDSTAFIKWGNKEITNISKTDLFSNYLSKEKIDIDWANKKFLTLGRGTGSDTWINIVLPLTKGADLKFYENCMVFDKENGIAVREWYTGSDTVLLAENIMTGEKQAIGQDWKKEPISFYHYCIDSISISNNMLYVKWVLPNKLDDKATKEPKSIKLNFVKTAGDTNQAQFARTR
jgi:hypothetical protein